jgi:hypothetical protein
MKISDTLQSRDPLIHNELAGWVKRFAPKPNQVLTESEIERSALQLILITHHCSRGLEDLLLTGDPQLAHRWVETEFAAQLSKKGLMSELGKSFPITRKTLQSKIKTFLKGDAFRDGAFTLLNQVIVIS